MHYQYDFGGVRIDSSFFLPWLRPFRERRDKKTVVIRLFKGSGPPPNVERRVYEWIGRYGMSLWSYGRDWLFRSDHRGSFLVAEDGRSITCFPEHRVATDGMEEFLARRVLPRVMQLHGGVLLHAATLSDGQGSCLLLGHSRAGKSTLAAALHHRFGWDIFSDDIAILDNAASPPVACSTLRNVCLMEDSLSELSGFQAQSRRLSAYDDKFWCAVPAQSAESSQPVRAFLLLKGAGGARRCDKRLEVVRVEPRNALLFLMRQLVRFNPHDLAAEGRSFKSLSQLTNLIPMYSLSYPHDYDMLPDVTERVRRICQPAEEPSR